MENLIINPLIPIEEHTQLEGVFRWFYQQYGNILTKSNIIIPIESTVIIDWACGWNKPQYIGLKANIVAMDDKVCLVQPHDAEMPGMYRHEDLIII